MMMQGSWDAIVPSYGDLPIYIPPLKAFLSFGSFVLFKPLNAPEASVGQLVHRDDTQKKIVVSLFDKLSAMVEMEKTVPRLSNETVQGVVEIVCTRKIVDNLSRRDTEYCIHFFSGNDRKPWHNSQWTF